MKKALWMVCIALLLPFGVYAENQKEFESTLIVSNQSFANPQIDVEVVINGKTAVNQDFEVKNQHNWKYFEIKLREGLNYITVRSNKGEAMSRVSFEATEKRWIVIDYWYYPETHYDPTPKHFSIDILNKSPQFV